MNTWDSSGTDSHVKEVSNAKNQKWAEVFQSWFYKQWKQNLQFYTKSE